MGWDGYAEGICENGHRNTWNPMDFMFADDSGPYGTNPACAHCQGKVVVSFQVDQTNGDSQGEITEENWKKLEIVPEKKETCNLGHVHVIEIAVYRIPTREELEKLRSYYDPDEPASEAYEEIG
jgi:hypothetical protein